MTSLPIVQSQLDLLLLPGLRGIVKDYETLPLQYKEFYRIVKSDKAYERYVEIFGTSDADIKPEGNPGAPSAMGIQSKITIQNQFLSVWSSFTHEAVINNLYKEEFPDIQRAMGNSLKQAENILAVQQINRGDDALFPIYDGVTLYATNHPTQSGTYANTFPTGVSLSQTALQDAITIIRLTPNASGQIMGMEAEKLIVHPALEFTATEILDSKYRSDTADNAVNALYGKHFKQNFAVNSFFEDSTRWMIKTSEPEGFVAQYREENNVRTAIPDPTTMNVMVNAMIGRGYGILNARATFSSTAS